MQEIYHYSEATGEFLIAGQADQDPLGEGYLIPAYATTVAPPTAAAGQIAVWNGTAWALEEDHRGTTVYDTKTGAATLITAIGALPTGVTALAYPGTDYDFVGDAWTLNATRQTTRLAANARALRSDLLRACDWTQLGDIDATEAANWRTYRQALRDVPQQSSFPTIITWPTAPDAQPDDAD